MTRAGGAQRRLARAGREHGVGIDRRMALLGHRGEQALGEVAGMDERDLLERCPRRLAALELREGRFTQRRQYCFEPRRQFRMMRPGIVRETGFVGQKQRRHDISCPSIVSAGTLRGRR